MMKTPKAKTQGSRASGSGKHFAPEAPHGEKEIAHGVRTITVQLSSHLYDKLSFTAGTTYGYSMSRIVREALEDKLKLMSSK